MKPTATSVEKSVDKLKLATSQDAPEPVKRRVLVIDDDQIVAESLAEFLRAEGHDAATALDAIEGLSALTAAEDSSGTQRGRARPPLRSVLIDLNLPGMGGLDLLREIRREHRDLPVIVLTGYGSVESAVESLRLGACDYLIKPVVDAELRLSLERVLAAADSCCGRTRTCAGGWSRSSRSRTSSAATRGWPRSLTL